MKKYTVAPFSQLLSLSLTSKTYGLSPYLPFSVTELPAWASLIFATIVSPAGEGFPLTRTAPKNLSGMQGAWPRVDAVPAAKRAETTANTVTEYLNDFIPSPISLS